jgi:peptide/nickel transport system permease protein/oligopeptide transport system permease protein
MVELPPSEKILLNPEGDVIAELPEGPLGDGAVKGRTLRADAWRRLRKNKLAMAGMIWVMLVAIVVASADLWVPPLFGDPTSIDTTTVVERAKQPPSWEHPFGTDKLGRDVLSRTVYGGQASLMVGVVAVLISVVIGLGMGALAGYYGGWWDSIVMRAADVFLSFPYVLFAIVLVSVLGRGTWNLFLAIGLLGWPSIARVFRSSILSVKENEYVDAGKALGASNWRIVFRHIMPNAVAPIIVLATMSIGGAILAEAGLSFLGFGVQPPNPSWGNMIEESRSQMFSAPWLMLFPGLACVTTVLGFVLLGDGLRDALDVKLKE